MELEELKSLLDQEDQNEQINIKELAQKYLAYWQWILGSIVLCLILGTLYFMTKPVIYSVNGAVLVNVDSDANGMTQAFSKMSGFNMLSTSGNVENEIEIIKSRNIMLAVIDSLNLHTSYTTKKMLRTLNLYNASPYIVKINKQSIDTLRGPINIEIKQLENKQYEVETNYRKSKQSHILPSLPGSIMLPCGRIDITKNHNSSPLNSDQTILIQISNPLLAAISLSKQIKIELVNKQVNVVSLTYNINNITQGLDVLNTLIALYNDDSVREKNKTLDRTEEFVSNRLVLLADELKIEELGVQSYKETNQITDISTDAKLILELNSQLNSKQIEVENQLSIINYVERFIADPSNKGAFIPYVGISDPGLSTVIGEYNKLVIHAQTGKKDMNDINPSMIRFATQIDAMYPEIKKSINNVRNALQITNNEFNNQFAKSQSKIHSLPRKEREFIELKRQLEIKQQLFQFLLQKKEEASLSKNATMPVCRFIETPASDLSIISPKRSIIFGIALVLGILIPTLLIFIYGLINTRIYSKEELEKITPIPILGEITKYEENPIVVKPNSNSSANELFRLLRANLQFVLGTNNSSKVLLVSSSQPGEGKTFISINLALSLSLSNKKVLLVGADIRKPRLAETLKLAKADGLTSILSNESSDYRDFLLKYDTYPNLDILQGGVVPPNPNELLLSDKVDSLFEQLRNDYDYIIVDTAPIGVVSDTFLLNRIADGMLFVVRSGVTTKEKFSILTSSHKLKQIKSPYIILNDIDHRSIQYSYRSKFSNQIYGYGESTK